MNPKIKSTLTLTLINDKYSWDYIKNAAGCCQEGEIPMLQTFNWPDCTLTLPLRMRKWDLYEFEKIPITAKNVPNKKRTSVRGNILEHDICNDALDAGIKQLGNCLLAKIDFTLSKTVIQQLWGKLGSIWKLLVLLFQTVHIKMNVKEDFTSILYDII